jgi:8-oxo-dGTP pyrophosphatase MutT (NUDIX family)
MSDKATPPANADEFPRIVSTATTRVSPWVTIAEKAVQFEAGETPHLYHCLRQADYVAVLATTPDGLIALVRQYRPCVEEFTWEFPAGTLDDGETAEEAARRELREETGLHAESLVNLGCFYPDTGRLQISSHAFFARASALPVQRAGRGELETKFVTLAGLHDMMRTMEFRHQLHWAVYAAAMLHGVLNTR